MIKKANEYLFFTLISTIFLSCTSGNTGNVRLIEMLQQEFINTNMVELECLSGKYDLFEEASIGRKKGLFSMDGEKIAATKGRINLVQTDKTAIAIAELILPSFPQKIIGEEYFTFASKYRNLWIVSFQSKTFEKGVFEAGFVTVVISKHTAEILLISY
jgi:hypothetical protein